MNHTYLYDNIQSTLKQNYGKKAYDDFDSLNFAIRFL